MGAVFRATDHLTGQTIALKRVLLLDETDMLATHSDTTDFRLTLAQEFKVLASMRHPHIISVLDYGFHDKSPYVAMELIERARTFIDAGTDASLEQQVKLLIQLLQALAYLHRRGILHHDLKPGNVLVTKEGVVKVLDFGLAAELGKKGEVTGTLAYMAPELLLEEDATRATDLYAVGVMAYEMLAGQHPFNISSAIALVNQVISQEPDFAPLTQHLDDDLLDEVRLKYEKVVDIIRRLLVKDPHDRYSDAYTVIEDLCEAINQEVPQESAAIRESFLQAAVFVGREQELNQLNSALTAAQQKSGSAWLVGGESGVGKTRLLEELRIRAMVEGITVLQGQGAADGGLAYQLWRSPLRRLMLTTEMDDVDAGIVKDLIPDIETLLEHEIPEAAPVEGAAYQQRLIGTIVSIFQRQTQPLLLLLEDIHWTTESLEVLKVLNGIVKELPLLIVASYRHDERPSLSNDLSNMQLMKLERFGREHIAELSASMLGEAAKQKSLIDLLTRETEGNVYFLVEVVRVLAEEAGRLSEVGRKMLPERVLAGGIDNLLQRRLARVPEDYRGLLELAAVGGRELDLNLLRNANGTHNLEDWLTICANCAVLEGEDNKWRFAHNKLRLVTIDSIVPERAADLHRKTALAIETTYPDQPEQNTVLVHHWHKAGDHFKERIYAQLAGDYALRINNFVEAIGYYERALELLPETTHPDDDIRASRDDLLISLGEALQYTGDYATATRHVQEGLELARAVREERDIAKALILLGDLAWRQGNYGEAKTVCEEGLEVCRAVNDLRGIAKALNRIGMVYQEQGDYVNANRNFRESLEVASDNNEPQGMTDAINNLGVIAFTQGKLEEATGYFEKTLSIARSTGERRKAAAALLNLGGAAGAQEKYDDAQGYLEETLEICRSIGERRGVALALHNLGVVSYDRKEYQKSLPYLEESLMISRSIGNRFGEAQTLSQMGDVLRMLGDKPDAIDLYRQAMEIAEKVKIVPMLLNILVGLSDVTEEKERALLWLGLVTAHPSVSQGTRKRANSLLESWAAHFNQEIFDAELERGKTLDLMEVVREILASPV
jgi:tetratricopeptide (TPR) repeat protein/tRNA A-37 threonylcarbamoyl transferase component Bud32